jgi:hypothetical protein
LSAAIHPAIGIGRIGNSIGAFFYGPEVIYPTPAAPGFYRDAMGALKRRAARFRIYGYNAAGAVVAELTTANASITWSVHLRNEKAVWYEFQLAMDIPEVADAKPAKRRNFCGDGSRPRQARIDGGTVKISGADISGPAYRFNGEFLASRSRSANCGPMRPAASSFSAGKASAAATPISHSKASVIMTAGKTIPQTAR